MGGREPSLVVVLGALLTLGVSILSDSASGAEPPDLLSKGGVERFGSHPTVVRERSVDVDTGLIEGLRPFDGAELTMNFFEDATFTARFDKEHGRSEAWRSLGSTWSGEVVGEGPGGWFVLTLQRGVVTGTLWTGDGRVFQVGSSVGGEQVAQEVDVRRFEPCGGEPFDRWPVRQTPAGGLRLACDPDDGTVIDVMIVYTPAARDAAGGVGSIEGVAANSIASTNTAYEASGVATRLRLVHIAEVAYTEAVSGTDLGRLRSTVDGYMDEIHAWREHFLADVVSLLRHQVGDVCGTAYVMTSLSKSFESQAFSVVQQQCAVPTLTFAHEVGHNQGACHAPGDEGCGMGLYPHSFGHRFVGDSGTTWRTVMAYAPGVRTNHFSNPARLYDGVATGTSERNNAATLNSSAWTVANFRLSTLPTIARVSNAPDGSPGTFGSNDPSVTPDGAYLVFASGANNLVPGDTNNATDVFVRDMAMGAVDRVSVSSAGGQSNDVSGEASISDDGRFVAFYSVATNLVPDDTNGYWDIFLHDRSTGETTRVNLGPDGAQANGHSRYPSISGDGRFIAYRSSATNLVPGGSTAGHVFVFDRIAGETSIVSRSSDGEPGDAPSDRPSVSYDGRYIAFHSNATNLVPDDTNGRRDVFVRDTVLGTTVRASLPVGGENDGRAGEVPRITGNGRFVAYESVQSTNRQARLYDALLGTSTIESLTVTGAPTGNGCRTPQASEDGRYVVYTSASDNIVYGDTNVKRDIFVRDRWAAVNYRVSTTYLSEQADGHSDFPTMTADGSVIVFQSEAQNLIPEGGNGRVQLYAHAWRECVRCPADMNADTVVNSIDFIVFLNAYSASEPRADFNGDTVVNTLDFIAFLNAYVAGCD